jgi:type II secretory pathway component GspD/PulD (secretin)
MRSFFLSFLFLSSLAYAQTQDLKLDKNKSMYVKFSNVNIDIVLSYFMKETKITIIKDPKINTNISIFSLNKVKQDEAYNLLFTSLKLAKIEPNIVDGFIVLKQSDNKPKINFSDFKFPETPNLKSYSLKYANAKSVANVLNNLFIQQQNNPFVIPDFFKASADDYSNSVIINTTNSKHEQVKVILAQLDIDKNPPLKTNVFSLKYASSNEIIPTIQNVLANLNKTTQFNVQSDSRTNSLVVSCKEEQVEDIKKIVLFLDQKVEMIDKTFLVMLQNAKPENITQILQQIFGR